MEFVIRHDPNCFCACRRVPLQCSSTHCQLPSIRIHWIANTALIFLLANTKNAVLIFCDFCLPIGFLFVARFYDHSTRATVIPINDACSETWHSEIIWIILVANIASSFCCGQSANIVIDWSVRSSAFFFWKEKIVGLKFGNALVFVAPHGWFRAKLRLLWHAFSTRRCLRQREKTKLTVLWKVWFYFYAACVLFVDWIFSSVCLYTIYIYYTIYLYIFRSTAACVFIMNTNDIDLWQQMTENLRRNVYSVWVGVDSHAVLAIRTLSEERGWWYGKSCPCNTHNTQHTRHSFVVEPFSSLFIVSVFSCLTWLL